MIIYKSVFFTFIPLFAYIMEYLHNDILFVTDLLYLLYIEFMYYNNDCVKYANYVGNSLTDFFISPN